MPDGSAVAQEVLHFDYVAFSRGPLVYATGLIDGYKIEETLPRSPAGGLQAEALATSKSRGRPRSARARAWAFATHI